MDKSKDIKKYSVPKAKKLEWPEGIDKPTYNDPEDFDGLKLAPEKKKGYHRKDIKR